MVQKLLHPYSPYHPSGAVSGAACCREKPVDAGGAFCYNVKAINGAVLKWSKRRDSKSSWLFGRGNPIFLGFKPLFGDCFKAFFGGFSPEILSKVFPERSARSNNLICGAVLKWSKRRDSKSRRPRKGCQGSNPCCSAKPNGQMNFIRLSILFCRNSARCTLSFWGLASCGCIAIAQTFQHSLCRRKFGSVVQVGIDVGGGGEVAVAQPFLDLLHGNAVC